MTFREKPITKLYAFAMAAVFALVLAGCGGGGGSAAVEEEPPVVVEPEPTPQEMCEGDGGRYNADGSCTSAEELAAEMAEAEALSGAQDAAMAAYMAAMAAVSGAKDPVAMGNAQPYAAMAKEASDMAAAAATSEMAMEYQMKAEMYRDMAMKAGMTRGLGLTTLANKITNQSAIDNAVLEGKPAVKPISNAGRVGAELTATANEAGDAAVLHTAVTVATPPVPEAGSVNQGGTSGTEVTATAAYGASGPTITVTNVGTTVLRGENPMLLTTRGGWMGRELVEDGATSMSYANVYTDIQAPVMKQNYGGNAPDSTLTSTEPHDVANNVALAIGQIITGDIPGDGSTFTGTRNVSATDNVPTQTGRFYCADPGTSPGCSISVDADGKITSVQGYQWQRQTSGTSPTNDADYLAWGVWLMVPDAAPSATDATTNAAAGAFASGSDVFQVRAELTGTATYNGVASGVYSAAGMVEYFDADVSLNANFGGTLGADLDATTADVNDGELLGAVTGSVSNIKAGGMDVEGSLTLKRAPVAGPSGTANGDSTTGFEGAAEGTVGGALLMGRWGGQFYGPNKATADTKAAQTEYPTTAAGTFAVTGGGHTPMSLLGSFGTWKAE